MPEVSFVRHTLSAGAVAGVVASDDSLVLGRSGLVRGSYTDPHQGGLAIPHHSGSWTGDWVGTPFAFDELVSSWSATTPAGTWVMIEMQAAGSSRQTGWYVMGVWASDDRDLRRTSAAEQSDSDGLVAVDTFVRAAAAPPLDRYRLRATLCRTPAATASPTLRGAAAVVSVTAGQMRPTLPGGIARDLAVPQLSQETHLGHFPEYDGGGEAWCSPTATAMVLRYWQTGPTAADLARFPGRHLDGEVDHCARHVFDWRYGGAGNWSFNTAYAAGYESPQGAIDAFVTRLRSLQEAERFIAAGIPLIASIRGQLEGYLFGRTNGHLLVIRGLERSGDVIVNDPAVMSNAEVRKTYGRAAFEQVWLEGSGGLVYVIRPTGIPCPANVAGAMPNW